jgi:hypothetical protein
MRQEITLNVQYDILEQEWAKVGAVYRSMDGWIADKHGPAWYGREGDSLCSRSPSTVASGTGKPDAHLARSSEIGAKALHASPHHALRHPSRPIVKSRSYAWQLECEGDFGA